MSFPLCRTIFFVILVVTFQKAHAQQAVSSIEQSRLFQQTPTATNLAVNADGTALADGDESSDDSFGTQVILKERERSRAFLLTGDTSVFYTSNAALTPDARIDDAFLVADAGLSWAPRLAPRVEAQFGLRASIFRYNRTSVLDFENLGAGAGLSWNPENFGGVGLFARYDFSQLLDKHSSKILSDHELSVGAQKSFALSRSDAINAGLVASAGVTDPHSAQRDQLGVLIGYHRDLCRGVDTDLTYRVALYRYNHDGRVDVNQVLSANLRYRFNVSLDAEIFLSFGDNRSNRSLYDYEVFTGGGGLGLHVRF